MIALRLHSDFSLLRAMVPVENYAHALKEAGYTGGALTDFDCGFGWVDFSSKLKKAGLKSILGTHLSWNFSKEFSQPVQLSTSLQRSGVSFLVANSKGYHNLCRILSAHSFKTLSTQKILDWQEGLFLLIPPEFSAIRHAAPIIKAWDPKFLYFEEHRHEGAVVLPDVAELSRSLNARKVATQPVYYLKPHEHRAHEILLSIGAGCTLQDEKRPQLPSKDFYLKLVSEMHLRFRDNPEWIEAAQEIADRVDFGFKGDTYYLPKIGKDSEVDVLFVDKCFAGLEPRLQLIKERTPAEEFLKLEEVYRARLERECGIIESMKFTGYFLIVADFIQWSKSHNIPVGPGRGSGAGSLAAYCLGITDIDPITYNLLFERFLNPERVSMPDFDIDFCIKGRDAVIQYVRKKYDVDISMGDTVGIATILTMVKKRNQA
mgnify:CR=1 FL=1